METARHGMNDFRRIRKNAYLRRFTPEDALARHERTVSFFRKRALEAPDIRRVIITHHSPDPLAASNDLISAAYCSDLEPLMRELNCETWISGHVQDRLSADTRLVSNAKGRGPGPSEPKHAWQNPNFNSRLTIEVGA
jgi:hypothetical protein